MAKSSSPFGGASGGVARCAWFKDCDREKIVLVGFSFGHWLIRLGHLEAIQGGPETMDLESIGNLYAMALCLSWMLEILYLVTKK